METQLVLFTQEWDIEIVKKICRQNTIMVLKIKEYLQGGDPAKTQVVTSSA